jgi:V8-like Glu-specific endopeptidase
MPLLNFLLSFACVHTFAFAQAPLRAHAPGVIYGQDSRYEYSEILNPSIRSLADATVVLVENSDLHETAHGQVYGHAKSWGEEDNLCAGETYAEQPSLGFCSGTLIAPDLVLTAGHCIDDEKVCRKTSFVFDFKMPSAKSSVSPLAFDSKSVYGCKDLVYRVNANTSDFAVIRLDRPVTDRAPATMTSAPIQDHAEVFMLGYPMGIPLKYANDSRVRFTRSHSFMTDLDAFGGNSGSGVFSNETNELLGILVSGEDDTYYDKKARCNRLLHCGTNSCRGETVMKISVLRQRLGI